MTSPQPTIYIDFVNSLFWDPRISFARTSTATYFDTQGVLRTKAANIPRWEAVPATGVRRGVLIEKQITNLILTSEDFSSGSWAATNATVTTNTSSAPDGATTADLLTIDSADGLISQSITITAGRAISFGVFAKPSSSNHLWLRIGDGVNTVTCWFDVSTGTAGTNTSGTGTCVFSAKTIEPLINGWYRCTLTVTTNTSTSFSCQIAASASDNTNPASTNSTTIWGAQAESPAAQCAPTSYIPTTATTATRQADNAFLPIDSRWYNLAEGTMLFEFSNLVNPAASGGASYVLGGVANTFDNTIYVTVGLDAAAATFISGGVGGNVITRTVSPNRALNTTTRAGVSWAANSGILVVNGGTAATTSTAQPPVSVARFGLGMSPWGTTDNGNTAAVAFRRFMYFDRQLTSTQLQSLTA